MLRRTSESAWRFFSQNRTRLSSNEAFDPNCAAYHTPRNEFGNVSVVSYTARLLDNKHTSTEDAKTMLKTILKTYPALMSAKHHGRCLWSHICNTRPDVVNFLLRFSNDDFPNVPTLPPAQAAMDESGNGLLMAPVSLDTLRVIASCDFFFFLELLRSKNEIRGENIFHHHSRKPVDDDVSETTDILFWLSEFLKKTPRESVTQDTSLPDINLLNSGLKTPLQLAIECKNPGVAFMLISLFGAFWFDDCLVAPLCSEDAPVHVSYLELARRVKSEACIKVLEDADKSFRIKSNTLEQSLKQNVICSICADGIKKEQKEDWYLLTCGHALHCICLMRFCASCSFLCCPECRADFETWIISKAPPTVHRIKYSTEEERGILISSSQATAVSTPESTPVEHLAICQMLLNNGVQIVQVGRTSDDMEETMDIPSRATSILDHGAHPWRVQPSQGPIILPPIPAPRSSRQQPCRSGIYGVHPSTMSDRLFHKLLSTIRQRARYRNSRGVNNLYDRYLSIIEAAKTVMNGFASMRNRNPTRTIDPQELYRRLESSNKPSYEELFGNMFLDNTQVLNEEDDAFTRQSQDFYSQIRDDARMAERGIETEDIKKFEEEKLIKLFDCLHRFLSRGFPHEDISINFSNELGVLITDAFDGSLDEEGLRIQIPSMVKEQLLHSIISWVLFPIIERYQCNALTCMDAYIESQMTRHGIQAAALAMYPSVMQHDVAKALLANAMKSQWLMLHSEHQQRRTNATSIKSHLATLVNTSFGVCKKGAESLLNLVIYTCNVML